MYKIKRKNGKEYILMSHDEHAIFGKLSYHSGANLSYITTKGKIETNSVQYDISVSWKFLILYAQYILKCINTTSGLQMFYCKWNQSKGGMNIIEGSMRDFVTPLAPYKRTISPIGLDLNLLLSSSHEWEDVHANRILKLKTTKGMPYTKEVEIVTTLDLNNPDNVAFVLFAFYLLPKQRYGLGVFFILFIFIALISLFLLRL